ncbi:class I SAM-dependent methyltransferase [Thermogemmatispora carboxidivorans]|uniref:class I SAM-dependent methyltransferase n=1 Tax=Thermogemmatispora carboxidivorans TaxID=1382306 RepID=UPI0006997791|nr:class I SAM-dependent methyltransferase [Thermogemmatispora carboxidivorans]
MSQSLTNKGQSSGLQEQQTRQASTRRRRASAPTRATPADLPPEVREENIRHRYFLQMQGERLFPESIDIESVERVLDVGCGSGEWVFALAQRYPRLFICGIDLDRRLLQRAQAQRNRAGLGQVEFRQVDFTRPFPLAESSFDFLHMRACARFIAADAWPMLLAECQRVLRPHGWLALVEIELCESSSSAFLELRQLFNRCWYRLGHALDESGLSFGVASRLYGMLLAAGLREVAYDVHIADLGRRPDPMQDRGVGSAGPAGTITTLFLQQCLAEVRLAAPLIIQQGLVSPSALAALFEQAEHELQDPDLWGWGVIISAYGRRQAEEPSQPAGIKRPRAAR